MDRRVVTNRFQFLILSLLVAACVSRSVPEERFVDSQALAAPSFNVSLPNPHTFTFAIAGDAHVADGDTTRLRQILNGATAEGDSFVILLGDIVDKGERADVAAVQKAIADTGWSNRVLLVIGNHDIFGDGWLNYKELNGPSHYSVTFGNSKFIALDTADGTVGKDQSDWLKNELEKPKPTHIFLLSHYLPVIPGQRTYLRLANESEAMGLMKLATNHGVRAWLGAHYHSYIVGKVEDVDYVVAGGGGGRRMDPVRDYFFVQVSVNGSAVNYTMRYLN